MRVLRRRRGMAKWLSKWSDNGERKRYFHLIPFNSLKKQNFWLSLLRKPFSFSFFFATLFFPADFKGKTFRNEKGSVPWICSLVLHTCQIPCEISMSPSVSGVSSSCRQHQIKSPHLCQQVPSPPLRATLPSFSSASSL